MTLKLFEIYKSDSKAVEVEGCLELDSAQNSLDISGRQRSVPGMSEWSFQGTWRGQDREDKKTDLKTGFTIDSIRES